MLSNIFLCKKSLILIKWHLPDEKGSIFDTAKRDGGEGNTGSTPDWMVAVLNFPFPTSVKPLTSKV